MKTSRILSASLLSVAMIGGPSLARADSTQATCELFKHGEAKGGASGPCTFSQRQGYIDIELKNGSTYNLTPTEQANHFKDQKGNKIVSSASGDATEFKWDGGRKLIVRFGGSADTGSASSAGAGGAAALSDLVGARGGDGEMALEKRGYTFAKGSESGDAKYGAWYNASQNQCVMIRTVDGRYKSIVDAPLSDCGR